MIIYVMIIHNYNNSQKSYILCMYISSLYRARISSFFAHICSEIQVNISRYVA